MNTHQRLGAAVAALAVVAAAVSGCGSGEGGGTPTSVQPSQNGATLVPPSGSTGSTGPSASAGTTVAVAIRDFAFNPATLTVPVGTTVTWTFQDPAQHNVTADNQSFKSADLSNGQTYSFTFRTPGTFAYICTIHPFMKGTVTVQ